MVDILGTRLGRYEVRERLGKGGMAAVYKAWDTNLDRWVAIKVLHDFLAEDKDFKARFEREAKVVASLNHPNIVQVYDFDVAQRGDEFIYYMVMAFITGPSLKMIMDEKHAQGQSMSLSEIENVIKGVCAALSYAHKQGMVHRDVTPGNILFNDHNQAVLADFGIARMVTGARLTQTGMTSGTPMYMSPEQGMGNGGDSRSDIYSLGIILYEMLVGEAPYQGDSSFAIIMKHVNEPPPPIITRVSDVPKGIEAVVLRAIAKDPANRYQTADQFLSDFEAALGGKSIAPATAVLPQTVILPTPALTRQTKTANNGARFPWVILVGGLVVIAIILFVAVQARSNQSVAALPTDTQTATAVATSTPTPTLNLQSDNQSTIVAMAQNTPSNSVPAMTEGPLFFADDFSLPLDDPKRLEMKWQESLTNPDVFEKVEIGHYHVTLTQRAAAITALVNADRDYEPNTQYEADVAILTTSQPESATGIVFRYQPNNQYYVFAVDGLGRFSVWSRTTIWKELRNAPTRWTPSDAVKKVGQTNRLKLIDLGNELIGFVNNQQVFDISIKSELGNGAIGLYLATTTTADVTDPHAEINLFRFVVLAYVPPSPTVDSMVDSMVDTPTSEPTRDVTSPTTVKPVSKTAVPTATKPISATAAPTSVPPTSAPPTTKPPTSILPIPTMQLPTFSLPIHGL